MGDHIRDRLRRMGDLGELWYDRHGRPITMEQWSQLYRQERHLGLTRLDDIEVSTVWIGLDHRIGAGPPLIFETMVFGGPDDGQLERYPTEGEAREGHRRWVGRQRLWQEP